MIQTSEWWLFLVLAPVVYWLVPLRARLPLLALASMVLMALYLKTDMIAMLLVAAAVFMATRLPAATVARLPAPVATVFRSPWAIWLVLLYFVWSKYLPALLQGLSGDGVGAVVIPLGVSYFSFKLLHYAIEARRGNLPVHGTADFAGWLFLAPIFTAGPIERFEHFLKEREIDRFRWQFVVEGVMRIAQGLVKKFVLGWLVLEMIEVVTGKVGLVGMAQAAQAAPFWQVWAALVLTLAYVYFDFSGYSDIAIGSSRLFGLKIMENFNMPLVATNLQMFWQRWHMTLAHFCRTYIYMSMIGLTRNPYAAVLATFGVMGLWHSAGPQWVSWGLWHGAGLAWLLYWGQWQKKRKFTLFKTSYGAVLGWVLTIGYVSLGGAFTALYTKAPWIDSLRLIGMALGLVP
jgi:alginate O-acetyltransferase complex protein AlgI